jgi:hypothetical protein
MTNRKDIVSPDALMVLTHALEKLRARERLTLERLDTNHSADAAPLLALAAVRRYAGVHDVELSQAALDVIYECIRGSLTGSQPIVAHLAAADALLLTFEIPRETLQHTLALMEEFDEPRPIVIVTPGQPYPDPISGDALS